MKVCARLSIVFMFALVGSSGSIVTLASPYSSVQSFLSDFESMTDLQRSRWQENNEWEHFVSGRCRVSEIRETGWLSAIRSPEADFVVDCHISSSKHVALYYDKSYENEMYALSKGEIIDFRGKLKTIEHRGFWNTAYVLSEREAIEDSMEKESSMSWIGGAKEVVAAFKTGNKSTIAQSIEYPISRKSPLPNILNPQDFIDSFDEIFTPKDIREIAESSSRDWSKFGWRGVAYRSGDIWLNDDGKIRSIRYISPQGEMLREKLVGLQKKDLHESVSQFAEPVLTMETPSHKIRIDLMDEDNYRYTAWSADDSYSSMPNLVIYEGKRIFDGNGGNHRYEFSNGNYTYTVHINIIGEFEELRDVLTVKLGPEVIFRQRGDAER